MSEMDSAPGKPPPAGKRPRFAVSVRVLLLLILGVALWIGWKVHRAREQRLAVRVLSEYSGFAYYDWQFEGGSINPKRKLPVPAWLVNQIGRAHV